MYDELIRDLQIYAGIAEENGKPYCAQLMQRAITALEKETGRPGTRTTGRFGAVGCSIK